MTFVVLLMLGTGALLIVSAIEDVSIRDTFASIWSGQGLPTPAPTGQAPPTPTGQPKAQSGPSDGGSAPTTQTL